MSEGPAAKKGWSIEYDANSKSIYFFNPEIDVSLWEVPPELRAHNVQVHLQVGQWLMYWDQKAHREYFFNPQTNELSWTPEKLVEALQQTPNATAHPPPDSPPVRSAPPAELPPNPSSARVSTSAVAALPPVSVPPAEAQSPASPASPPIPTAHKDFEKTDRPSTPPMGAAPAPAPESKPNTPAPCIIMMTGRAPGSSMPPLPMPALPLPVASPPPSEAPAPAPNANANANANAAHSATTTPRRIPPPPPKRQGTKVCEKGVSSPSQGAAAPPTLTSNGSATDQSAQPTNQASLDPKQDAPAPGDSPRQQQHGGPGAPPPPRRSVHPPPPPRGAAGPAPTIIAMPPPSGAASPPPPIIMMGGNRDPAAAASSTSIASVISVQSVESDSEALKITQAITAEQRARMMSKTAKSQTAMGLALPSGDKDHHHGHNKKGDTSPGDESGPPSPHNRSSTWGSSLGKVKKDKDAKEDEDEDDEEQAPHPAPGLPRASTTVIEMRKTSSGAHPILPCNLQKEIQKFQLEGYANAHFRVQKKRKGLFKQAVPMREALVYQKEPITKSLLKTAKSNNAKACRLFVCVQQYMGDAECKTPLALVAQDIVNTGVKTPGLRDEIFCQVCKQCTENPNPISVMRGLQLLAMCASQFAPTVKFQDHFMSFLNSLGNAPAIDPILPGYVEWRVKKTMADGPDSNPLTPQQLEQKIATGQITPMMLSFHLSIEKILQLQKHAKDDFPVPRLLAFLMDHVKKLDGFNTQGIFRLAGEKHDIQESQRLIESGATQLKTKDPMVPADLIKMWFREMQEPLIPKDCYDKCMEVVGDAKKSVAIIQRVLPPNNLAVMKHLILFLKELAKCSKKTSMGDENLALVFCPNILRSDCDDPTMLLKNSAREKLFVKNLIVAWPN